MARRLLALLVFACGPTTAPVTPIAVKDPPPVVSKPAPARPTLRLPKTFVPARYDATLTIDPAKAALDGSIAIAGKITESSPVIWLHGAKLTIKSAVARGPSEVALEVTRHDKEELLEVRPSAPLAPGDWTLAFEYSAPLDTNNTAGAFKQTVAGSSYVYSQLEATYARRVFPCVDEPDSKVPWKLTLDVPKALTAVSNTPATETVIGDLKRVEFAQTKPLPTYLVAFGVGPFDIVDAGKTKNGTPVRIVTLAKRGAEAAWAAKTTVPLVEALEEWFGIPYPYEKLDMLSIPLTVGFGAMENAGLITFTETLILHEAKVSKARLHDWVIVAAHELAHQWFGNLVTMVYWDDIWLNEGFANWMETKVTGKIDPSYRDELGELDERNGALGADALVSARRIRQPIEVPDDIANVFDGITYNKGAAVLNMFERYVGAETFQKGVREYLRSRAYGNATSKDFVAAIAKAANNPDIEQAFSTFLDRPGAPEVTVDVACEGKTAQFRVAQKRYLPLGAPVPTPQGPWSIPMCFAYDAQGKRGEFCKLITAETQQLDVPVGACPRWVMPNVDGRSYLRVAYTTKQITALRDEAWDKLTWSERRAVFFDVDAGISDGKVPLQLALSFIPKLLTGTDRFTLGAALELATGVEWLVPDELRTKYEYWLRTTFSTAATATGFEPKDSDTLDTEATRKGLIGAVAWTARDPALVAEALRLAGRYRELPQAMRGLVLTIAVDARPELFEQVKKELYTEPDRSRRSELLGALGSARDPALHAKALELTLDTKLDIRETEQLFGSGATEANRDAGRAFFAKHADKILARIPPDGTAGQVSGFAWLFTGSCKAGRRDEIVAYVKKTFEPLPGGVRTVKQAIESMDTCIAKRKVVDGEVRAWLSGLRIPKPTQKAPAPAKAPAKTPKSPKKK
jgi:alanyl aminopeptidase